MKSRPYLWGVSVNMIFVLLIHDYQKPTTIKKSLKKFSSFQALLLAELVH